MATLVFRTKRRGKKNDHVGLAMLEAVMLRAAKGGQWFVILQPRREVSRGEGTLAKRSLGLLHLSRRKRCDGFRRRIMLGDALG